MSEFETPALDEFHLYDTTLRDGAQREGISYSVSDKLAVTRLLDSLGVGFIEGGWPGAMPKDTEFFARARDEIELQHALLVAFGATRKAGVNVEDDKQVAALLAAETPVVTIVAKSDVRHVRDALHTTLDENSRWFATPSASSSPMVGGYSSTVSTSSTATSATRNTA